MDPIGVRRRNGFVRTSEPSDHGEAQGAAVLMAQPGRHGDAQRTDWQQCVFLMKQQLPFFLDTKILKIPLEQLAK